MCFSLAGSISSQTASINEGPAKYARKIAYLKHYMASRKLDPKFRARVIKFHEYIAYNNTVLNDHKMLESLPTELRLEVAYHLYGELVASLVDLCNDNSSFLMRLTTVMTPHVFMTGATVVCKGDIGREMFFVKQGRVQVMVKGAKKRIVLEKGSYFGDIAMVANQPRTVSLVALTVVECLAIHANDWEFLMLSYPVLHHEVTQKLKLKYQKHLIEDDSDDEDAGMVSGLKSRKSMLRSRNHKSANNMSSRKLNLRSLQTPAKPAANQLAPLPVPTPGEKMLLLSDLHQATNDVAYHEYTQNLEEVKEREQEKVDLVNDYWGSRLEMGALIS